MNGGRLEAKGKETVPSQDRLFSEFAFPSLFFLVVMRAPLAILGDPGWICGMKGDQSQCQCKDGRGIDLGGIRAEHKHDTRKVILYIDSGGQMRGSSAQTSTGT